MKKFFKVLFVCAVLAWSQSAWAGTTYEERQILRHMDEIKVFERMTGSAVFVNIDLAGKKDRFAVFLYMTPQGRVERKGTVQKK